MIEELDTVVLTRDMPQQKLRAGDVGTVVLVHGGGVAFEVEFMTLGGRTIAVVQLPAEAVRKADDSEVSHARRVA